MSRFIYPFRGDARIPRKMWYQIRADTYETDPCWCWVGGLNVYGYGRTTIDGKAQGTHRVIYIAFHGLIPDGMTVGHRCHDIAAERSECKGGATCRHRSCCKPGHLLLQTKGDNCRASPFTVIGDHSRRVRCPRGHALVGDNLLPSALRNGIRACLECNRLRSVETSAICRRLRMCDGQWRALSARERANYRTTYRVEKKALRRAG